MAEIFKIIYIIYAVSLIFKPGFASVLVEYKRDLVYAFLDILFRKGIWDMWTESTSFSLMKEIMLSI